MPLHPSCFRQWQGERDLDLVPLDRVGRGVEVDYGHHWRLPDGRRARLSWNVATGVLYLHHPDPEKGSSALLVPPSRQQIEALLTGWDATSCGDLEWLGKRLWLVGATLPDWAYSVSRGG